ncbi:MAG: hypothetical protein ABI091_22345 [Ferruginibacter sp.]
MQRDTNKITGEGRTVGLFCLAAQWFSFAAIGGTTMGGNGWRGVKPKI